MNKLNALAVAAALALVGCTQSTAELGGKSNPNLSERDNAFFRTVALSDKAEIASSQLALEKSSNPKVREFATKMISDHKMADAELMQTASTKEVVLPQQLDEDHQKMADELKSKSGSDFDKAYIDMQVTAHQATVDSVSDEAQNGNDSNVKNLAESLLPKLQGHLNMAKMIQGSMSNG